MKVCLKWVVILLISLDVSAKIPNETLGVLKERQVVPFRYANHMKYDNHGRLWALGYDGLYILHGENITPINTVVDSTYSDWVSLDFNVNENQVIATSVNGVSLIDTETLQSKAVSFLREKDAKLTAQEVLSLGGSRYLIGAQNGLYLHDVSVGHVSHFSPADDVFDVSNDSQRIADRLYRFNQNKVVGHYFDGLVLTDMTTLRSKPLVTVKDDEYIPTCSKYRQSLLCILQSNERVKDIFWVYPEAGSLESIQILKDIFLSDDSFDVKKVAFDKGMFYLLTKYQGEHYVLAIDESTGEDYLISKLGTQTITYFGIVGSELISLNIAGELVTHRLSIPTISFSSDDIGRMYFMESYKEDTYVHTSKGIFVIRDGVARPLEGWQRKDLRGLSISPNGQMVIGHGHSFTMYDLKSHSVLFETKNNQLSQSVDETVYEAQVDNQVFNLTIANENEFYYESYNDGLWHYVNGEHILHESNEDLRHVEFNNAFAWVDDRLLISHRAHSLDIIEPNGQYRRSEIPSIHKENRINHRWEYVIGDKYYLSHGNSLFTEIGTVPEQAKQIRAPLPNASCIQPYTDSSYLSVSLNRVFSWTPDGKSTVLQDLRPYTPRELSLDTAICHFNKETLYLITAKQLLAYKTNSPFKEKELVNAPIKAYYVLDSEYRIIDSDSMIQDGVFETKNPNAEYLSVQYANVNQYQNISIQLNTSDVLETAGVINVPIGYGTNEHKIIGFLGHQKLFEQNLVISKSYTMGSFLKAYTWHLVLFCSVIALMYALWVLVVKKTFVMNARMTVLKRLIKGYQKNQDVSINNCLEQAHHLNNIPGTSLHYHAIVKGLNNIKSNNEQFGHAISDSWEASVNQSYPPLNEVIEILDNRYPVSSKVQYASNNLLMKVNLNILLFHLHEIDRICTIKEVSISMKEKRFIISLELTSHLNKEVRSLSKSINNSEYSVRSTLKKVIISIGTERSSTFNALASPELHSETSIECPNLLFIGDYREFDSKQKTEYLEQIVKEITPKAAVGFCTSTKMLLEIESKYPITKRIFVNIYSQNIDIIERLNIQPGEHSAILVDPDFAGVVSERLGCSVVITSTAKVFFRDWLLPEPSLSKLLKPTSDVRKRFENAIQKFVQNQSMLGPDSAVVFPRSIPQFLSTMKVRLNKIQVEELESEVGESLFDYAKRYRARLLAAYIKQNVKSCSIQEAKAIHGFGEKSRTISIFKEEYGMTPDEFRKSLLMKGEV